MSTKSLLVHASKAIAADVERSGGRVALHIPPNQPAQNLQLLAFFGHKIVLIPFQQLWQQSSSMAGIAGLSQLFPVNPYPALAPWPVFPQQMELNPHQVQQWSKLALHQSGQSKLLPGGILRGGGSETSSPLQGPAWARNAPSSHGYTHYGGEGSGGFSGIPHQAPPLPPSTRASGGSAAAASDLWMAWEEREGGLGEGCSLFDDGDVRLLREMMAETVVSTPGRAHELASGQLNIFTYRT